MPEPEGYKTPDFKSVEEWLLQLKRQRRPVIERIWEAKKALRGEWDEVLRAIPRSYRGTIVSPGVPQIHDYVQRTTGIVSKERFKLYSMPPSARDEAVTKATDEEAFLTALFESIEEHQGRGTFQMGVDAQLRWGESWIGVWPDPRKFDDPEYKRGVGESAKDYSKRYEEKMARDGVPLRFDDYDPQTVYPFWSDFGELSMVIIESEHMPIEVEMGMGYAPLRDPEGKVSTWVLKGHTLSEGYVPGEHTPSSAVLDINHDRGYRNSGTETPDTVKKTVYVDKWTYQMYLDEVLVEEWKHGFGMVPVFGAYGEQSSDRDPAYQSVGIVDGSIAISKHIVLWAAVLASGGIQQGFPTPFVKNAEGGITHAQTGQPITRRVRIGEMNLMGLNEEIVFPFLEASSGRDFKEALNFMMNQLEETTLSNFGRAVGSDVAGYALAQIRAMQLAILAPVYDNCERQWREIAYFTRFMLKERFPGGVTIPGAVKETEQGQAYREVMTFKSKDFTDYPIKIKMQSGIVQDEIAEQKQAIENNAAGGWSTRRMMEKLGVDDPQREMDEIDIERVLKSPAADEAKLQLALQMASMRFEATRQQESSPFGQALEYARQQMASGSGTFQNQGAVPANANAGGTPAQFDQQTAFVPQTQQGGGTGGLQKFGVPGLPGGVKGKQQNPTGLPG